MKTNYSIDIISTYFRLLVLSTWTPQLVLDFHTLVTQEITLQETCKRLLTHTPFSSRCDSIIHQKVLIVFSKMNVGTTCIFPSLHFVYWCSGLNNIRSSNQIHSTSRGSLMLEFMCLLFLPKLWKVRSTFIVILNTLKITPFDLDFYVNLWNDSLIGSIESNITIK